MIKHLLSSSNGVRRGTVPPQIHPLVRHGAPPVWPPAARRAPPRSSANDKLNIAIVGFGGKGGQRHPQWCSAENIVALCDADEKIGADVRASYPKATYYQDFRKMLEKEKTH